MRNKQYALASGMIFAVVAALHGLRFVYQWPLTIGAYAVPLWASAAVFVVTASLAVWGLIHYGR